MYLGVDVSTYLEEIEKNAHYYDGKKEVNPLELLRSNGVDYMRIRLWVNPYDESGASYKAGNCDLNNFLKLSKLALNLGYNILLDFHYSDFWADPGKQFIPKDWVNLSKEELIKKVYDYTFETLNVIKASGIEISMIQIGNEITNGILWPIGKIDRINHIYNYETLASLLKAGLKASSVVFPNALRMLHLEKSYDHEVYDEFFSNMEKYNVEYEIIGASYYPYWHGTFKELFDNLKKCEKKYKKKIVIAEVSYAFTLDDYEEGENSLVINPKVIEECNKNKMGVNYPFTQDGQKEFIKDFLKECLNNNIYGVFYWEPLWIPGDDICFASNGAMKYIHEDKQILRNEWSNQCLFDYEGKKTKGFDEFKMIKIVNGERN